MSEPYYADDRARGLLRRLSPTHLYNLDPASGAGNCTCGAAEHHRLHPHEYLEAAGIGGPSGNPKRLCVCALPKEAGCHR